MDLLLDQSGPPIGALSEWGEGLDVMVVAVEVNSAYNHSEVAYFDP